jgi:5-methyltetrahydrofolate--homocysteine methyltransferase
MSPIAERASCAANLGESKSPSPAQHFLPVSEAGGHPIWIKANAGLPQMQDGRTTYAMTPAEFAGYVPAVLSAGANFIGGCCGTTPEFIRELHRQLHGK